MDSARPGRGATAMPLAWLAFGLLLLAQVAFSLRLGNAARLERSPGAPPSATLLRLASLEEPILAGYATILYVQGFDAQAGAMLALRDADAAAICAWLQRAFDLNPHSGYPLMLAAFDYAEPAHIGDLQRAAAGGATQAPAYAPLLLDFVEQAYGADPARHWRWLVHAAWVARYKMHDDARALRLAHRLRDAPAVLGIPRWARELDSYVLRRGDPLDAQRALLGGMAFASPGVDRSEIERLAQRIASPAPGDGETPAGAGKLGVFPQSGK